MSSESIRSANIVAVTLAVIIVAIIITQNDFGISTKNNVENNNGVTGMVTSSSSSDSTRSTIPHSGILWLGILAIISVVFSGGFFGWFKKSRTEQLKKMDELILESETKAIERLSKIRAFELNKRHLMQENTFLLSRLLNDEHKEIKEESGQEFYNNVDKLLVDHHFQSLEDLFVRYKEPKDLEEWERKFDKDLGSFSPWLPRRLKEVFHEMKKNPGHRESAKLKEIFIDSYEAITKQGKSDHTAEIQKILSELKKMQKLDNHILHELKDITQIQEKENTALKMSVDVALMNIEIIEPKAGKHYTGTEDIENFKKEIIKHAGDSPNIRSLIDEMELTLKDILILNRAANKLVVLLDAQEHMLFTKEHELVTAFAQRRTISTDIDSIRRLIIEKKKSTDEEQKIITEILDETKTQALHARIAHIEKVEQSFARHNELVDLAISQANDLGKDPVKWHNWFNRINGLTISDEQWRIIIANLNASLRAQGDLYFTVKNEIPKVVLVQSVSIADKELMGISQRNDKALATIEPYRLSLLEFSRLVVTHKITFHADSNKTIETIIRQMGHNPDEWNEHLGEIIREDERVQRSIIHSMVNAGLILENIKDGTTYTVDGYDRIGSAHLRLKARKDGIGIKKGMIIKVVLKEVAEKMKDKWQFITLEEAEKPTFSRK